MKIISKKQIQICKIQGLEIEMPKAKHKEAKVKRPSSYMTEEEFALLEEFSAKWRLSQSNTIARAIRISHAIVSKEIYYYDEDATETKVLIL
jgi:hypothetical protein